jgi:hypothetical protein
LTGRSPLSPPARAAAAAIGVLCGAKHKDPSY